MPDITVYSGRGMAGCLQCQSSKSLENTVSNRTIITKLAGDSAYYIYDINIHYFKAFGFGRFCLVGFNKQIFSQGLEFQFFLLIQLCVLCNSLV